MTSITQSSYISTSSKNTSMHNHSHNLYKIETDVFNRVVSLKNQKIQLLQHLSECIDKKYRTQAELLHHLEIKKKKQDNLALPQQYQPAVYRNIELKTQIQELQRQVQEKSKAKISKHNQTGFGNKSRAKSVYDLNKSKRLYTSGHSKSKISQQNSKFHKLQAVKDEQDQLIQQIIQQRKANSALSQIIREQKNTKIQEYQNRNIASIKQKMQALIKFVEGQQQARNRERLSKSVQRNSSSRMNSSIKSKHFDVSDGIAQDKKNSPTAAVQVQVNQLRRYIQSQNQDKILLYEELSQFVSELNEIKDQNQRMKKQLIESGKRT